MTTASLSRDALIPRSADRVGRGLSLALIAHALLIVAIAFGVNWRASEPAGVEAELWASVPQIAAPKAVEPDPPKVQPKPPEPPPKPEPVQQKQPDAQIAIEKAKKEEDKRKEELAQKQKLEEEKKKDELKKKELADKQKREAEQKLAMEKQREDQLKRILAQAGATGEPTSTGTAQRTAGPSSSYAGRIKARVLPNIVFSEAIAGNPLATVEVKAAPDGTIIGRRLVKSSGVKAWDDAVLRAIDKTEVLPRDTDGRVPSSFEIDFRVRE
jgi:colicin import membrane protein